METNVKNKWQIRLAVLAIFGIGFLAGGLITHVYDARQRPSSAERRGRFDQVLTKLSLTPEQRAQVEEIFEDARAQLTELRKQSGPKFREVREQTDTRLQKVLTPEQWQQFQQLTKNSRDRRSRGGGGDRDNH